MFKPRNVFTILLVSIFLPRFADAQIDQTAALTVNIANVVAFVLTDVTPTIIYDDSDDYEDGVTYTAALGGTVTSTNNFSVSVAASTDNLVFGTESIPVSSIAVQANGTDFGSTPQVNLSSTPQDIIAGAPSGIAKIFGLTYSTTGGDDAFLGKPTGIYATTLTYTATLD